MNVSLDDIRKAASLLDGAIVATPTVAAGRLSRILDAEISLKLESLQHTGSFKTRGALIKLLNLGAEARRRGVIAMSAGNHAQGVAFHCRRLNIPATIVMPKSTPFTKIERTTALGAQVRLEGDSLSDAAAFAHDLERRDGLTFIHPYDDPLIVAGQGTIGLELLTAAPTLEVVVVPIGGGGLIAGIATAIKALNPAIRILGVQAALYPTMARKLAGNSEAPIGGSTLAEGIAVKQPGELTSRIIAELVEDVILVPEPLLERAVNLLITEEKLVVEGAGAAPLAALLADPARFAGKRIGLVISGGNIDARVLASILMRGLASDGRIARLRIEITDAPGMLARVAGAIAAAGGNIIEIYHQRLFQDVPVMRADLDVVVETRNTSHLGDIVGRLEAAGFVVRQLGNTGSNGP
ncbi:MAG: threonine ammonia-lyase [Rhodospirillales bacterium]|nr:threonine ammonia-lyase [Rhodospirillales bacterium]